MALGSLPEIEIFHGIFTTINVIISFIIGLRIAYKYREFKRTQFSISPDIPLNRSLGINSLDILYFSSYLS